MHAEAMEWISRHRTAAAISVLDIGGRNINGSPRHLFPNADYTVLDIADDDGVDIVADAATWKPDRRYDVVVCAEVFEHTPHWVYIVATAWRALRKGGLFVATMAGPGRESHSAVDGGVLKPGEHYANIDPAELTTALQGGLLRFGEVTVDQLGADVRCAARRV